MQQEIPSLIIALIAGFISFISPCVLPLVPAYLSFISGVSIEELQKGTGKTFPVFLNTLFFVLGFSAVFVLFSASASFIGKFLTQHKLVLEKIAGIIIVLFGIHLTGLFRIRFLDFEKKINIQRKPIGFIGSLIMGFAFAFGWTPCIGPILGSIIALAALKETLFQGTFLLFIYSLGLGIPFILSGLFVNLFFKSFTIIRKHLRKIEIFSGILLIILGIVIFFGELQRLAYFLPNIELNY